MQMYQNLGCIDGNLFLGIDLKFDGYWFGYVKYEQMAMSISQRTGEILQGSGIYDEWINSRKIQF